MKIKDGEPIRLRQKVNLELSKAIESLEEVWVACEDGGCDDAKVLDALSSLYALRRIAATWGYNEN